MLRINLQHGYGVQEAKVITESGELAKNRQSKDLRLKSQLIEVVGVSTVAYEALPEPSLGASAWPRRTFHTPGANVSS